MTANAWQRATSVSERQRGLLTLQQAGAAGLSNDQVEYATDHRGWQRLERTLYCLPGSPSCWQRDALAAILLAGDQAVASHLTAAALWGWAQPPLLPHISVPPGRSNRTKLARVHRSVVAPIDRATRQGIRCTSASRTLIDCAPIVERARLEQFVDDALCSGIASGDSVANAVERAGARGRPGVAVLRRVLSVWTGDISPGSPAEARLLRRLAALGLHDAVPQCEVFDEAGRFVARLDVGVPTVRFGFEYDSDRWHSPRRWAHDEARYARLGALGWRVEPVAKPDLLPSSTRLAELVSAVVRA